LSSSRIKLVEAFALVSLSLHRNVCKYLPTYAVEQPRRAKAWNIPRRKPEIWNRIGCFLIDTVILRITVKFSELSRYYLPQDVVCSRYISLLVTVTTTLSTVPRRKRGQHTILGIVESLYTFSVTVLWIDGETYWQYFNKLWWKLNCIQLFIVYARGPG